MVRQYSEAESVSDMMDDPAAGLDSLDPQGLSVLLRQRVLDAEESVHQMDLHSIRLMLFGYCLAEDQLKVELRPRILPALKSDSVRIGLFSPKAGESKAFRRVASDGSLVVHESREGHLTIGLPVSITDVDTKVLHSGAAIYPGCKDDRQQPVIILCCNNEIWAMESKTQLAKLLDYLYYVTRENVRSRGLVLLIDARNAEENLEKVMAVVNATKTDLQKMLSNVYIVLGEALTPSDLSSPLTDLPSHVREKVVTLENADEALKIFGKDRLPVEVGGSLVFSQQNWVQHRQRVESFMRDCYAASSYLVAVTEELMCSDELPKSVRESEIALMQHEEKIRKVLNNDLLHKLCSDGESVLKDVTQLEESFSNCAETGSESAGAVGELFHQVQSAVLRLEELAEERQQKLDGCLQLRQFEEQASQVINQLCTEGEDLLAKYLNPGDNLRSAKLQQVEFNKAYAKFMQVVSKGREVIEEAAVLTNIGICDELMGVKEICRQMKFCMTSFTARIEAIKQTIDNTHQCYQLLDQSFDWTLKTMKFVVDLKLGKERNLAEVERSRTALETFMVEHPPLSMEVFNQMDSLLQSLSNQKLSEQWLKAKGHCLQIDTLIKQRHETLIQVLNQLKSQTNLRANANVATVSVPCDTVMKLGGNAESRSVTLTDFAFRIPDFKQVIVGPCSMLTDSSNNDVDTASRTKATVLSSVSPNANSSPYSKDIEMPLCLGKLEKTDDVSCALDNCSSYPTCLDLNTLVPCVGVQCCPVKHSSLDIIIPPISSTEMDLGSEPLRQHSSSTDYLQPNVVPHRLSQYSDTCLPDPSQELTPSQPFDVREYMLKDSEPNSEPNTDVQATDVHPWNYQSTVPDRTSEKPPTGLVYSSISNLQNPRNERFGKRNVSWPSSVPRTRNTKPSWRSIRKVISNLTDGDLSLGKRLFRKRSSERNAGIVDANSTESLPGRFLDDDNLRVEKDSVSKEVDVLPKYEWSEIPSNSHLFYTNRLALSGHTQSMLDVRLNDDDVRRNRVLSLIVRELIMTESDYIQSLDYVISNYIPELLSDDIMQPLRGKKNVIFGNIEKIFEFHSQIFIKKIERCQSSPFQLGACFLQHESEFYLYSLYNKNKPKADMLMADYGTRYFKRKQRELDDRMDLSSYLLKPVQRLGKYALILRQIIKECPETHPAFSDLQAALELVRFQLRHGNNLLAMDCLRECDVNLQEQGMLLRQQEFLVFHGRKKCLRQVFLFEELVIFSKTRHSTGGHDTYIYKSSIKTSDLGLTESVGESGCQFELWFRKRTLGTTYVLQSQSPDIKQQWVADISQLLWQQILRNRERRLAEMAYMGMGSKPSLDIKQSKDNINDRFINIGLSSRSRAVRPKSMSMACSYDSQRPHSLISVSSISSSASSYSSGYGSCLSSGYGASGGTLTTTEESPLEYIMVGCEEAALSRLNIQNNTSGSVVTNADDSAVMVSSASASDRNGATEKNCTASVEEDSEVIDGSDSAVSSERTVEDAYTQTTLMRPLKKSSVNARAPIVTLESDSDDFY